MLLKKIVFYVSFEQQNSKYLSLKLKLVSYYTQSVDNIFQMKL